MVHNLAHTVLRGRSYDYNRRVPKHIADSFGVSVVRVTLGSEWNRAACLAEGLTARLDAMWSSPIVLPVNLDQLVRSLEPPRFDLLSCLDLYLSGRDIDPKPVRLAVDTLIRTAGNRDVTTYTRNDARQVIESLSRRGNKKATIRRRLQSLHAVVEFGFHEQDVDKRNPFARLSIPSEGRDSLKRGVFTCDQLTALYAEALLSGRDSWLVIPTLGETGARLAEVVGLRWADVCFVEKAIKIEPHALRRLKTRGSERVVPLVGFAFEAWR